MTLTSISRRTVLRGLGTAVALPILEAMLPRTLADAGATGGEGRSDGGAEGGVERGCWRLPAAENLLS